MRHTSPPPTPRGPCFIKNTNMHATYAPKAQFYSMSLFELWPNFRKSAPNNLDMFKVKTPNWTLDTPRGPYFHPLFTLQCVILELRPNFGKVHQITPNDLDMFKVKTTNRHATYTPKAQIFIYFSLQGAIFWVTAQFSEKYTEWPQMTLTCPRSKHQYAYYIHPRGPSFLFRSMVSCFRIMAQFREKCTEWDQNDLDIFKVKRTNMDITYIPKAQTFVCFPLRWAVFEKNEIFEFPIGHIVKFKSLKITLNELKISKFQKEHSMGTTISSLKQVGCKKFKTVEGVVFWNFHSVGPYVNEN